MKTKRTSSCSGLTLAYMARTTNSKNKQKIDFSLSFEAISLHLLFIDGLDPGNIHLPLIVSFEYISVVLHMNNCTETDYASTINTCIYMILYIHESY